MNLSDYKLNIRYRLYGSHNYKPLIIDDSILGRDSDITISVRWHGAAIIRAEYMMHRVMSITFFNAIIKYEDFNVLTGKVFCKYLLRNTYLKDTKYFNIRQEISRLLQHEN